MNILDLIKSKQQQIEDERVAIINVIKKLTSQLEQSKLQLIKLDGAAAILSDLIENIQNIKD